MDVKDKINKLLALAESPNEHEAQLALLKAKELMMQYKLSVQDLHDTDVQVLHHETKITFSKRRASWSPTLASVIAENYCCRAFSRRRSRQQTRTVCLAGFQEDIELCEKVLTYALTCINLWIRNIVSLNRDLYTAKELSALSNSYAKGYIAGIYTAYRRQTHDHAQEWALLTVVDDAVDQSVAHFKTEHVARDTEIVQSVYNVGFGDGVRFSITDKLESRKND